MTKEVSHLEQGLGILGTALHPHSGPWLEGGGAQVDMGACST